MANLFRRAGSYIAKIIQSSGDPAAVAGQVQLYAKDSGGTTKLFIRDGAGTISEAGAAGGGLFGPSVSTVPTAASTGFSSWWYQFAGSTYTDGEQGPLIMIPTGGSGSWSARAKAAPATPYTITMLIAATFPLCTNASAAAYVGWAETATGAANKADLCAIFPNQSVQTYRYQLNTATSVNNQSFLGSTIRYWPEYQWFRLTDDGTTVTVRVSATGDPSSFMTIMTQTKAGSFLGLAAGYNYILFGATAGTPGSVQLLSYKQT